MTTAIALQELLVALYDSVDGARRFTRQHAPDAVSVPGARRAMDILSALGAADILATTAFDVTEVTLRFDCELHKHHGRSALRLRTRRLWRTSPTLPLEIKLYGSDTLRTDVRLGNQLLKSIAGRPRLPDAASRR